jgi:hypothetical protein|tara:strand:+ start:1122 stop:2216 length:1095 start_codon:yes stop_codon:yes gene_type:complete
MKNNFAYPSFAIGIHSGWCEGNDPPTRSLFLTNRKRLKLRKYPYKVIKRYNNLDVPYLIKTKEGDINGLSSGVGSSIVSFKGNFFKMKRNGYKDLGFIIDKIPDRHFSLGKNTIYEETENEDGGAMSLEDAKREIQIENTLKKKGFLIPQETIALYGIKLPFSEDNYSTALIQRIETDLRADELCIILLTNLFYDVLGRNFKINLKDSYFEFEKYSLKKGLEILNREYRKIFLQIGINIGSIYKRLHKEGYLRGIGNSWYGNELICKNGDIGLCDLESCFTKEEINNDELFKELCKTDVNSALTAFYDSMNFFENSLASFIGLILIEGFNEGYNKKLYKRLNIEDINNQIDKFIKIKKFVIKDD